jgi:DNA-binding NtrC family response regulator
VREIQNCAERAIILADYDRELEFADFILTPPQGRPLPRRAEPSAQAVTSASAAAPNGRFPSIAEMERQLIEQALQKTSGNRNEAAKMLDINVRTLRNKLKEYAAQGSAIASLPDDEE